MAIEDATLNVKPGPNADPSIAIQRVAVIVPQSNGTAEDQSTANPAPVSSVPGALVTKAPTWASEVVEAAGTAVQFKSGSTLATRVQVMAKLVTGDNTGNVYIGGSSVDKDTSQGHELQPGDTWEYVARNGTQFDLSTLYIDAATTGDGIIFVYEPA